MRLTKKLLDFLHSVFDKSPAPALALRLGYDGAMSWTVSDAVLTTEVDGGSGANLSVDLRDFNMQQLATFLASQPGYEVAYLNTDLLDTGARSLIDGTNSIDQSNGDHLFAYTSVLWSYLEAIGSELDAARQQIVEMLNQMSTRTAEDVWLDELGSYYGVPRLASEPDSAYGPRIIAEVLRPRGNNIAIGLAIKAYTGEDSDVTDVHEYGNQIPQYDGTITHDGTHFYNSTAAIRYGLFDVSYGYDLINGGDFRTFETTVRGIIDRLRDAGTHMRALTLKAGNIVDTVAMPKEGALKFTAQPAFDDEVDPAQDDLVIPQAGISLDEPNVLGSALGTSDVRYEFNHYYNGLRTYNGRFYHEGGMVFDHGTLEDEAQGDSTLLSTPAFDQLHEIVNVTLPSDGYF